MPRNPITKCDVSWDERYGTTISGSLAQYKVGTCIEDTVDVTTVQISFPWVNIRDFHYYNIQCPYAIESNFNYVRITDRTDPDYWNSEEVASGTLSAHTSTSGIMIKHSRGRKHGWLCVDPNCSYYMLYGQNYFYY